MRNLNCDVGYELANLFVIITKLISVSKPTEASDSRRCYYVIKSHQISQPVSHGFEYQRKCFIRDENRRAMLLLYTKQQAHCTDPSVALQYKGYHSTSKTRTQLLKRRAYEYLKGVLLTRKIGIQKLSLQS